jgi:hypothetical protein
MPTLVISTPFPSAAHPTTMPAVDIEWAPTTRPTNAASWTSIADRTRAWSTKRGRPTELDRFQAGTASILLDNKDRRLDPSYADGPWYGNIAPQRQYRIRAKWNGVEYGIIHAYADGFPQSYPGSGFDSVVELQATDAFKLFALTMLVDQYEYQLRSNFPTHLWRLDEKSGTTEITAYDSGTGTAQHGSYVYGVEPGQPPIRLGSRSSTKFSEGETNSTTDGYVDVPVAARPSSTTAWTIEAWVMMPVSVLTSGLFIIGGSNSGTTNTVACWVTPGNGNFEVQAFLASSPSGALDAINTTTQQTPHHIVLTYTGNSDLTVFFDGVEVATDATVPATFTFASSRFRIGTYTDAGATDRSLTGYISDFAIYDGVVLSDQEILDHYNAGTNGFSGEGTGTHAERILDILEWPAALRDIAAGDVNVGTYAWSGTALDYLQTLERTELAQFYIETDGTVIWRDRSALTDDTRSNTSQATFGDGGGAELPYADIEIDGASETSIYNDVLITRDGGTPQRATDTTSIEEYGTHSYAESGSLDETDATAAAKAAAILSRRKEPKLRVLGITVNPQRDPDNLFPQVLGRKIGDRITVKRRPLDVGAAIDQDCWIESIAHDVTPDTWMTRFGLVSCD